MHRSKLIGLVLLLGCLMPKAEAMYRDFVDEVDVFIGTLHEGNVFPGACTPFGLVQASPDTKRLTPSGYDWDCNEVIGFSNTHLSGTGNPALGDVRMMPFAGSMSADDTYVDSLDRSKELGAPDYYTVRLEKANVTVEATASERVGIWRFTYHSNQSAGLFFDPVSSLMVGWSRKWGPNVKSASMVISPDGREIRGGRHVSEWANRQMFYCARFDRPFKILRTIPENPYEGAGERLVLGFDMKPGETIEVRVAISTVSPEGAASAFAAEVDGKSFDQVRRATRQKWNDLLGRCRVEGEPAIVKSFYTSLYHLCIQPSNIADVDGSYRGADFKIAKAKGGEYYSTLSLWDTFRAAHPFYTLLCPERVPGFVDSMLAHGRAHGHLPIWTMWGDELHDMIGVHSIPVIVDAWKKGFRGFDEKEALKLMIRSLTDTKVCEKRNDWNIFWENGGYYPYRQGAWDENWKETGNVSRTLEIAYDWWCIAEFAEAIGNPRAAADARKRAAGWRKVFDTRIGFVRPRGPSYMGGEWKEPFDPRAERAPGQFSSDFTEGNSWQYTWHVFQEPFALAELLGGKEKAVAKLDEFFSTAPIRSAHAGDNVNAKELEAQHGQIGQYWHGNEPSHHIIYFYTMFGAPEKAQNLLRRIVTKSYRPIPGGLCGNDDCGQMSAWYLFTAMGFYPVNPCGGDYVIGAPQLNRIELALPGGKKFVVRAENLSEQNKYVKSVTLNGAPLGGYILKHADIIRGGELVFEMNAGN